MYLDLWIHQNTLMWSRLQVLWFIQFGLLSLSAYLYSTAQSVAQPAAQVQAALELADQVQAASKLAILVQVTVQPSIQVQAAKQLADAVQAAAKQATVVQVMAPPLAQVLNVSFLAKWAALFCALATFGLERVMHFDRLHRDIYRKKIEKCKMDIFPASLGQNPFDKDESQRNLEATFHKIIFGVFIVIDFCTSWVLGLNILFKSWVLGLISLF